MPKINSRFLKLEIFTGDLVNFYKNDTEKFTEKGINH